MSAGPAVLELPVRQHRATHPCGCYIQVVPERGRMRWLRFPSAHGGSGLFSTEDGREILERGWLIMDGVRAMTRPAELGCPHWVELYFPQGGWMEPHP